ncbi:MAG: right-handed parallel beta-helix repeat-containing protein [Sedimentisphaerales bacterium]
MQKVIFILILSVSSGMLYGGIQDDIGALGSNGGTVIIPAGITIVSQTIKVPNNVTLEGNAASSVLKAAAGLNAPVIQNISTSGGNSGMRFIGFKIDGNAGSSTGAGIRLVKCNNIIFKDMQIYNCSDGIEITGSSSDIVIRQCKLYLNGRTGVYTYSGNGIKIDGTDADLRNVVIAGCTIYSNYYSGIHCRYVNNIRIYDNYIYDQDQDPQDPNSGDDSIKLFRCNRIVAFANRLDESRNCGIEFWGTSYYAASANHITHSDDGQHAILSAAGGNGCGTFHLASGQGYIMLGNMVCNNVVGIASENNRVNESNPNAVISSNITRATDRNGLHHVHCTNTISTANLNSCNGIYDPPDEGTADTGTTISGSENFIYHGNLNFDNRADRDQMFGLVLRGSSYVSFSDNIMTGSEIMDLRIEPTCSNLTESSNVYHNPVIRFIVSNPTSPTNADPAIKSMLDDLGYTVNYYDDNSSQPGTLTEDIVLISNTVNASVIGSAYRSSPVPVVIFKPAIMTYMELADTGSSSSSQTNINVATTGHYITSFFPATGSKTVALPGTFGYISGNVIGSRLASLNSEQNNITVVAVEKNMIDQLGIAVPQRRAFLFLHSDTYNSLSNDGKVVFRRSVEWALGAE